MNGLVINGRTTGGPAGFRGVAGGQWALDNLPALRSTRSIRESVPRFGSLHLP
jgi:hypothetical protein